MSTSEQELRGQIAGMREALRSARASARTGKIVGILGVLVGLCVVAIYVLAFINLGKSVAESKELPRTVLQRVEQLRLQDILTKVVEEAAPVYLTEARELLKDMELPKVAQAELRLMLKDVEPVVRAELERVSPELQQMLLAQKDRTLKELQRRVERKLGDRLTTIVGRQQQRLETDLGLDEQKLATIVTNLQDACLGALGKVVERRVGNVEEEMQRILKIVAEIPPLPQAALASRESVLNEMVRVLVALLKHNLPDYKVDLRMPVGGGAEPGVILQPRPGGPAPGPRTEEEIEAARAAARSAAQANTEAGNE